MNTKPFKPVFNNPLKKGTSAPERKILSGEHGDWTQVQIAENAVAPTQAKKPNIKKTATENSRKLVKNLKKKQNKQDTMKLPMTSLTDTEYDEIFSLAINRAMTAATPSPGNSDVEDEIESRAAIPDANEALSPQEEAVGPIQYTGKYIQAKETFSKNETAAAPHCHASDSVSESSSAEGSSTAKKQNAKDVHRVAKKIKVPVSTRTPNLPSFPIQPKKQETPKLQDNKQKCDQECKKHANAYQNFKPACNDNHTVPKMQDIQGNQASKLQDSSVLQKSTSAKNKESAVKEPSQLSQHCSLQQHSGSHSKHSTQCSHHSQKCDHVCNNKHIHSHSSLVQDRNMHEGAVIRKSGCQMQCSQAFLSQPGPELSLKERLLWLQKRRDVGLWVQCSRLTCNKWRFLQDIRDPVEVPQEWVCHMNSDKRYNSCTGPEKPPTPLEEEDFIHNIYTAGSIVWGRLAGYPWWPAMVDDCPDVEQYYWLNSFSDIPTHYNVVFFDENPATRAWLTPSAMRPFTGCESSKEFKRTIVRGIDYAKRLQAAKLQAQKALSMGISERLRTFGFLARYKGPIGSIKNMKAQDKRKAAEDQETFSQKTDKDGTLLAYRNLQEDGCKEKPKRKRAKSDSTSQHSTKKTKVQAVDNEGRAVMSEATDTTPKINSNEVHQHDSSSRPNQIKFTNSLYTQELSNKETEIPNKKLLSESSSTTNTENVSAPGNTQPSEHNEEKMTDEMQISSDNDNEIQFTVTAEQDETIINYSQDLFLSQTATSEWNTSEKNKADFDIGIRVDVGLHKSSTCSGANNRNANANNVTNKMTEVTADTDTCMATVGKNSESDHTQSTNSILNDCRIIEKDEANHKTVTETESSAPVLLPATHNPSTSNAYTASHLNCSGSMPLVPDIQHNNFHTKANKNCDAVVPQLADENSDDNSYVSPDFEPEE